MLSEPPLNITFLEVEQQKMHVCPYFAIGNAVHGLIGEPKWECLPNRDDWQIDLTSAQVEELLGSVLATSQCSEISRRVVVIDQDECLASCCAVTFPRLRTAVDTFSEGLNVALLINCQGNDRPVTT